LKPQAPLPHTPAAHSCKLRAPAYKAPRLGQREQSSRTGCMWQFHQHMACLGHCVSLHAWRASLAETTLRQPEGALPFFAHTAWDWTWLGQAEIETRAAGSVVVLHTAEDQSSSPHDLRFARPRLGCLGPTHLLSRQHLCNSVHSTNLPHAHAHSACTQRVWRAREAPGGVLCAQADRRQAVAAVQPTLGGDHSRTTWPSRPRPPRPGLALPLKHQHCSSALSWLCPLVSSKTVSPHMVAGAPQQSTAL
jgi:hypothetical protein